MHWIARDRQSTSKLPAATSLSLLIKGGYLVQHANPTGSQKHRHFVRLESRGQLKKQPVVDLSSVYPVFLGLLCRLRARPQCAEPVPHCLAQCGPPWPRSL